VRCGVGGVERPVLSDGNGAVRFSWDERCPSGGVAGRFVLNAVGDREPSGALWGSSTCFPRAVWETRREMLPSGSVISPRTDGGDGF